MPRSAFRGLMPGSEQAPQPEQRPGRLANSVASHFGAMSTSARVSPQPATTTKARLSKKSYSRLVWKIARPRIAQFVVIKGS